MTFPSWDSQRAVQERVVGGVDQRAVEAAVAMLLTAIGEDPSRPGLAKTPGRVARAWVEFTAGLREDPADQLATQFEPEGAEGDLVIQRAIPFYSLCEHHLVPFFGHASVAYLPNADTRKIVGISKLVRVVRLYGARLQVQERLTAQIADAVFTRLSALGVAVVIQAEHLCVGMRGIKAPGSVTTTSALRGLFFHDARARAEVMSLLAGPR